MEVISRLVSIQVQGAASTNHPRKSWNWEEAYFFVIILKISEC